MALQHEGTHEFSSPVVQRTSSEAARDSLDNDLGEVYDTYGTLGDTPTTIALSDDITDIALRTNSTGNTPVSVDSSFKRVSPIGISLKTTASRYIEVFGDQQRPVTPTKSSRCAGNFILHS